MELNQAFWEKKYLEKETPWDIGQVSKPLKDFIDSLEDKNTRILIPGAGRGHEAVYLFQQGFGNVFVCDWVSSAFDSIKEKCASFPCSNLIINDFFELDGKYDLILEQTFFCAIDPSKRPAYVEKTAQLLEEGGILAGLFFASSFERVGPPFGGTQQEYEDFFEPSFEILKMEVASNSILPRMGNELFFKMIVK